MLRPDCLRTPPTIKIFAAKIVNMLIPTDNQNIGDKNCQYAYPPRTKAREHSSNKLCYKSKAIYSDASPRKPSHPTDNQNICDKNYQYACPPRAKHINT